jgi:hypothetical protein
MKLEQDIALCSLGPYLVLVEKPNFSLQTLNNTRIENKIVFIITTKIT